MKLGMKDRIAQPVKDATAPVRAALTALTAAVTGLAVAILLFTLTLVVRHAR